MAGELHAAYIKIVATGGDLDSADEYKLNNEVATHVMTPVIAERNYSSNPNPNARVEVGHTHQINAVLGLPTYDHYVQLIGGTHNASVFTKTQSKRVLPKYDIRIATYRDDGQLVLKDWTNMQFTGAIEESWEQGESFFLPFEAMSTDESDYTADNSA